MSTSAKNSPWSSNMGIGPLFGSQLDSRRFFPGSSHEEALSRFHFLVSNRRRLGLLVGPSGVGKSMVCEVAARQFRQLGKQAVVLSVTGLDLHDFLWKLAVGLGSTVPADVPARSLWQSIEDQIVANRYQRIDTVLFVDHLEHASPDILTAITRLTHTQGDEDARLSIVMILDASALSRFDRRLQELCDLRVELTPWTLDETRLFLRQTLQRAGCNDSLYTAEAVQKLQELTGGLPRRVQQLAHLSLVAAAAQELTEIDASTLAAVQGELCVQSFPVDSTTAAAYLAMR